MTDNEKYSEISMFGNRLKIQLTVQKLLIVSGSVILALSVIFSVSYWNLKRELDRTQQILEKDKLETLTEIEQIVDRLRENDTEFSKDISDIKGNIKVILDRTDNIRNSTAPARPFEDVLPPE
ncbi:MAG TPA: hypothetical protein DCQ31_16995 [Bacteroidales bacterium]|nr:hypothetical protein [Bacteroidales bacterium]